MTAADTAPQDSLVLRVEAPLQLLESELPGAPPAAAPGASAPGEDGTAGDDAASGGEIPPENGAPGQPQVRDPGRFTGHAVHLSVFDGPLDLLLYLVRAHRYDICDIPISDITRQFIEYLTLMQELELDLEYAGDFLVTAATLMQIKSRMLLPQHESQNEDAMQQEEADPRRELVERLLEYQRFQEAAETLKEMGEGRANTFARIPAPEGPRTEPAEEATAALLLQDISTFDLLRALQKVLDRQAQRPVTTIRRDPFTLSERVRDIFKRVGALASGVLFDDLCDDCQSRLEVVITFLAMLELISRKKIVVEQRAHFDEILVRARTAEENEGMVLQTSE